MLPSRVLLYDIVVRAAPWRQRAESRSLPVPSPGTGPYARPWIKAMRWTASGSLPPSKRWGHCSMNPILEAPDTERAPADIVTLHPSAVLRARSDEERQQGLAQLIQDLRGVKSCSRREGPPAIHRSESMLGEQSSDGSLLGGGFESQHRKGLDISDRMDL